MGRSGPVRAWKFEAANVLGTGPRRCDLPNYAQGCIHASLEGIREDGVRHVALLPFRSGDTSQNLEGGCFHIAYAVLVPPFFWRSWHRGPGAQCSGVGI